MHTVKLNLGCGGQLVDGWVNVDRDVVGFSSTAERWQLDIVADDWPWTANSVDGIVLHHVLDLLEPAAVPFVLRRCHDVLKVGAPLRASGAHLALGVHAALRGDEDFFAEKRSSTEIDFPGRRRFDMELTVGYFITQGGARKQWISRSDFLAECNRIWFSDFGDRRGFEWINELDTREKESWFATVWK